MRAYVLTTVQSGHEWELIELLKGMEYVRRVDFTFGPYDVIVEVEAPDLHAIGKFVARTIRCAPGVIETVTCLAVERP